MAHDQLSFEVHGTRNGRAGRWSVEASSEEAARRKAIAAGVAVQEITSTTAIAVVPPEEVVIPTLTCANCGRMIGRLETPWEYQGNTVCPHCASALMPPEPAPAQAQNDAAWVSSPAPTYQTTQVIVQHTVAPSAAKGINAAGLIAVIFGAVALVAAWIPFFGLLVIPVAALGMLLAFLGFIAAVVGRRSGAGLPFFGFILCAIAAVLPVLMTAGLIAAGSHAAPAAAPASAGQVPIDISAAKLVLAYHANEVAADESYKGKLLTVDGVISSIRKDIFDKPEITLQGLPSGGDVICEFSPDEAARISQMHRGEHLTVTGSCGGMFVGDVKLTEQK